MECPPLVSIVIPCYNAANFIVETIDSVRNQSYSPIEIIVVNDGSTDDSLELLKQVNDINLINQKNSGVSVARNKGFEKSCGEFICFLDADDWLYPNTITDKVHALQNTKAGLAHGIVEVTDNTLGLLGEQMIGKEGMIIEDLLNYSPPAIPCPSNALIAREVFLETGGFDPNLSTSADYDLWIRIAQKHEVVKVNTLGVKYRQHETNMFSNLNLQIEDLEYIFKKHNHLKWNKAQKKFYRSIGKSFLKDFKPFLGALYILKSISVK